MGYLLLWVESLAAGLLLIATAMAFHTRTSRRWLGRLALTAAIGMPFLIGAGESAGSIALRNLQIENNWLVYTLSWTFLLFVGAIWIVWRGKKDLDGQRAAANWPLRQLGIAFIAAFTLHLITFWNLDSNMRLRLASVRMEAGSIALAAAPPRVPDAENAAFVYEKCFEARARIKPAPSNGRATGNDDWYRNFDKAEFKTADPELREYLRALQPTLALTRRAAAMPGCYFEHEYAQPSLNMTLPELSEMRHLGMLLAADARVKAADGKYREAFENISAMRALAQHVTTEPILISGLVANAVTSMASDTLEGILITGQPASVDFAALPRNESFSFRRVLRRCMAGEEAFGMSAFAMIAGDADSEELLRMSGMRTELVMPFTPFWRVFLLSDDLAAYRSQMKAMRELTEQKFSDPIVSMKRQELTQNTRKGGLLSGMLMPALNNVYRAFSRGEARHRLADFALSVAAYRAKNGKFPAQPQDLVPEFLSEIPSDPYDDKPMRMLSSPTSVTLYSIGEDLKDDGGAVHDFEKGDIVFKIGGVQK